MLQVFQPDVIWLIGLPGLSLLCLKNKYKDVGHGHIKWISVQLLVVETCMPTTQMSTCLHVSGLHLIIRAS